MLNYSSIHLELCLHFELRRNFDILIILALIVDYSRHLGLLNIAAIMDYGRHLGLLHHIQLCNGGSLGL